MDGMTRGRVVLIYDEDCGFCRWSVDRILAWDREHRLRPLALQTGEADELLRGMPPERRRASWHLVTPDGIVRSGGAGAAPLLRELPGGGPMARVARTLPGPTDAVYRLVARNRDRLGRLLGADRCGVTPGTHPSRPTGDG
jgi:predicted DCC family thiol-disulfide oxidoreductase YuxK